MRRFRAFFSGALLFLATQAHSAELTVHADMPPPDASGSAVYMDVPGFDPALGTLTSVDVCNSMSYSSSARISTSYYQPFTIGAPVSYSIDLGMGASFGYFDAAGWVAVCDAGSAAHNYTGTLLSFIQSRVVSHSGAATGCVTIVNPTLYNRFVSATLTPWYMQKRFMLGASSSDPAYPIAAVGAGSTGTDTWGAAVDVTYHYTPNSVAVQTATWAATKAIYR